MNYTKLIFFISFWMVLTTVNAQKPTSEPVEWKFFYKRIAADQIALIFEAEIMPGWSLPAQSLAVSANDDADTVEVLTLNRMNLSLQMMPNRNTRCVEKMKASRVPKVILGASADKSSPNLNYYTDKVKFVQLIKIHNPEKSTYIRGNIYYNWLHPKKLKHGEEKTRDLCFRLLLTPDDMPVLYVAQSCKIVRKAPQDYKVDVQ